MKSLIITSSIVAAVVGLNIVAEAQSQSQETQASSQDTSFIQKAAEGNLTEVELGKLGSEKSQNSELKTFSQHLQTDHQSANQKLESVAQKDGVQMPQALDSKHQGEIDRLSKLSGTQFDQEFATTALKDHAMTIALFQKEAQQGQDQALKQYAQELLPALQHHLHMAENAAKTVGVNETTISSILSRYPGVMGGASTPGGHQHGTSKSGY